MQLALLIIGTLTIILTLIIYFTPLSDTEVDTSTTVDLPIGSREFFKATESVTGSSLKPISPDQIQILSNGDEFMPDLLQTIKGASKSITVTNYILKKGEMGDALLDALIERAQNGIKVKLLLDGKGSIGNPEDKVEQLRKAGGQVAIFRPINFFKITRANKRSHVRAIVVDGQIGYLGGLAFEDGWLGDGTGGGKHWRDLMFKLEGNGASTIQDTFNTLWRQTEGEILSGADFYPEVSTLGASNSSQFVSLMHVPTPDLEKNLSELLWLSIKGAKNHLYLETPYLLPDKNILKALKSQAKAGVDVELVVPGPYIDSSIVQAASRSYYKDVLASGVKIYEYQAAGMHAKILTADGKWSIIGSANLDNRSSTLNIENVMGVYDERLAKGLEAEFAKDKALSKEITTANFKPNILVKLISQVSRLFSKQY